VTWTLLLALTLVTAASRVLPMTLLPHPRGHAAEVLQSLPAPLFAGLAALALVGDGTLPGLPAVLAGIGALLGSLRRSLGLALVCGVAGFLLGGLLVA
jgi:branched-subunit amino acid transport protein